MTKRHTKGTPTSFVQLPFLGTVAIYARVASPEKLQAEQISQIDNLKHYALELGFQEESIMVFEENATPGTTALKAPSAMTLLQAISQGKVQAVLIADEERLFRNTDAVQVNTFTLLCQEQNVLLLTPRNVYDFRNEQLAQQFRIVCLEEFHVLEQARANIQRRTSARNARQ
jgi:predicted site-specific integrase-resolvase